MFNFNSNGILGQNERNLLIQRLNTKQAKRFADSKIRTKNFFTEVGVSVPRLLLYIKNFKQIEALSIETLEAPFVIKPNKGAGGRGILVIEERTGDNEFRDIKGDVWTFEDLKKHFHRIISGYFSITGGRDTVLIEEKVIFDNRIKLLATYGLPDIRVIVYNNIPLMAMLRIPTKESGGKANIHQGATSAGIDLADGTITTMMRYDRHIRSIPGMGDIRGVVLPEWEKTLRLAVQCQKTTNIPYLACDIALDAKNGPVILELNVRPGLSVQNANGAPLAARIKKVQGIRVDSIEKGVRVGMDLFGHNANERIKNISGKQIVGTHEYMYFGLGTKVYSYITRIDPNIECNYMSQGVYENLKASHHHFASRLEDGATRVTLTSTLVDVEQEMEFEVVSSGHPAFAYTSSDATLKPAFIVGRGALKHFLLDPDKYPDGQLPSDTRSYLDVSKENAQILASQTKRIIEIDEKIIAIEKRLKFQSSLVPVNLLEQKDLFLANPQSHMPTFEYKVDVERVQKLVAELEAIELPDIPLIDLYRKKKEEILLKADILLAVDGKNDKKVSQFSSLLYGGFKEDLVQLAYERIESMPKTFSGFKDYLTEEEIKKFIEKFNHIYQISLKVIFVNDLIARFSIGRKAIRIRKGVQITQKELRSVIAHEIETHFLRRKNGAEQILRIFESGTAGYLEIEEGLAIYNQSRFLTENMPKHYTLYRLYASMHYATTHSYKETLAYLTNLMNGDMQKVFRALVRMKRGIIDGTSQNISYKDLIYVNGYEQVGRYIHNGGSIKDLYIGKVHIDDLNLLHASGVEFEQKNLVYPLSVM